MRLKKERLEEIRTNNAKIRKFHKTGPTFVNELVNEIDALNAEKELLQHTISLLDINKPLITQMLEYAIPKLIRDV